MKYMKTIRPDDLICPRPKISTRAAAGAAVGAVIGRVCGGEGGAVIGGLAGYALGKCLEPKGIDDVIIPLHR